MKEFIDKIIERLEEEILTCQSAHAESIIGMCGKSAEHYMSEKNAYEKIKKIVNQLSEEYNNGWIPCSERLPKESELVLIYAESTARGGSVRAVACLHNGFWFTQTSSDTLSLNGIGQYKVIAWQTLPASYKEGE